MRGFRIERDKVCIVTALADVIETVVDIEAPKSKRTDALKFLIHLMGDIHQPLHVGFRYDSGGNAIKLDFPRNMDLHFIWDTWLVDQLVRRSRSSSWKALTDSLLSESPSASDVFSENMFSDREALMAYASNLATNTATLTTCTEGYTDHLGAYIRGRGHTIVEKSFLARMLPVVKRQLQRAGFQLAQLIEAISSEENRRRVSAKAVRREAVGALFSNWMQQTCTASSELTRYSKFSILPLDFGPEIDEEPSDALASTAATKKVVRRGAIKLSKSPEPDFDSLVKEFTAKDAVTRNYELVNGIDLSRIRSVLIEKEDGSHYRLVTDTAILDLDPTFKPTKFFIYTTYLPVNGTYALETFHFDLGYFVGRGKHFTDDVRIRALLKLANKDCTIDLSELLSCSTRGIAAAAEISAFAPVRDPAEACRNFDLVPSMLAARTPTLISQRTRWNRSL